MKVEARLLGIETLRDDLRELYAGITKSRRPLLEDIAAQFAATIRGNLSAGSDVPLDPDTITRRRYAGGEPTGELLASISSSAGEDYAAAGTDVDYAGFHQFGFKHAGAKGRKVKGRPFVWLESSDLEAAMDKIEEFVLGAN